MEHDVLIDLATETFRKYGDLPIDFVERMAKRIRRKFKMKLEPEKIKELAIHYKEMYAFGKSILRDHLRSPEGKSISAADVDTEMLIANLRKKYPNELQEIIQVAVGYLIYYEYLR